MGNLWPALYVEDPWPDVRWGERETRGSMLELQFLWVWYVYTPWGGWPALSARDWGALGDVRISMLKSWASQDKFITLEARKNMVMKNPFTNLGHLIKSVMFALLSPLTIVKEWGCLSIENQRRPFLILTCLSLQLTHSSPTNLSSSCQILVSYLSPSLIQGWIQPLATAALPPRFIHPLPTKHTQSSSDIF